MRKRFRGEASTLYGNVIFYQPPAYGSSVRDAFAAVVAKGDEIKDEYHGCIY